MAEPAIAVQGAVKTFRSGLRRRSVVALADLSLEVEPSSVVAFVGPNGAGKTTTMNLLLGLLRPDSGSISLLGRHPGSREARRQLGFLSEVFYTYPFLTARKTLRFYGRLSGLSDEELSRAIPFQLDRLGLAQAMDRKVGTFSKGMTQRLGLAQALLHEPRLLLLDEPTTGLDPQGRRLVAEIVQEQQARGTTVFLSSHILSDVERSCDRVVMIRDGRVVLSETLASLTSSSDEWEIEVHGWSPGLAGDLAPPRETDGAVWFDCSSKQKKELLRRLIDLPVEIGSVRRRSRSLEDLYMEHVGGNHDA